VLGLRLATAAAGIPLIVLLIWAGGGWYTGVVAAILAIATLEFQGARGSWLRPLALISAGFSAGLALAAHVSGEWLIWVLTGIVLVPLFWVTIASATPSALPDWLWAIGGILYIGWLGCHLVLLRDAPDGRDWVFLAVLSTFATDTGAYFTGKSIGRTKLAPSISPGKTVEGACGGYLFGLFAVLLANYFLGLRKDVALIVPVALLLPLFAQAGDLIESKLKRSMQVKDASQLIPGHGGLMDRLDSVLLTIVMVYYYIVWVLP